MDYLQQLTSQVQKHLLFVVLVENAILVALWWVITQYTSLNSYVVLGALVAAGTSGAVLITKISSTYILEPTKALWQAILHVSPRSHNTVPPHIESLRVGRALVTALTTEIYQLVSQVEHMNDLGSHQPTITDEILASLPTPVVVIDSTQNIVYANALAAEYVGSKVHEIVGKNFYSMYNMSFSNEHTFDTWLSQVSKQKALATNSWDRVRLKVDDTVKQFDLAAYYSKDNPAGIESTLLMFDHTHRYNQDDGTIDFVALSVHELRTPLTLLRGYIEVFEEELSGSLTPELQDFMHKMKASAEQLNAFVSNILNVARIDNDQLELSLQECDWGPTLTDIIDTLKLRAQVRGITLEYKINKDLPPVGADRVSIYEVVNNLVDNAIKYSGQSDHVLVSASLTKDGLVETTVQDWGIGLPENVMPHLFNKFYRNFHNRAQIGGTGLGLYLCKAIISAHGGNIWVRSSEGKGTVVGFTLLPYDRLASEQKNGDNKEIVRGAHGWIKNHSLYRR